MRASHEGCRGDGGEGGFDICLRGFSAQGADVHALKKYSTLGGELQMEYKVKFKKM